MVKLCTIVQITVWTVREEKSGIAAFDLWWKNMTDLAALTSCPQCEKRPNWYILVASQWFWVRAAAQEVLTWPLDGILAFLRLHFPIFCLRQECQLSVQIIPTTGPWARVFGEKKNLTCSSAALFISSLSSMVQVQRSFLYFSLLLFTNSATFCC